MIDIKQNEINQQIKAIIQIRSIWNLQDNKMLFSSEAESVELKKEFMTAKNTRNNDIWSNLHAKNYFRKRNVISFI